MPDITILGWFHTVIGILALVTGFYSLARFKVIQWEQMTGKIFLICTFIAAATALGIYSQTGSFNIAHGLAVLTLLALAVGRIAETTNIFGGFSKYFQAIAYSGTFLFHMIPAITDGLRRLPVGDPIVTKVEDPLLLNFYLAFLVTYLIGVTAQIIWLRKSGN